MCVRISLRRYPSVCRYIRGYTTIGVEISPLQRDVKITRELRRSTGLRRDEFSRRVEHTNRMCTRLNDRTTL